MDLLDMPILELGIPQPEQYHYYANSSFMFWATKPFRTVWAGMTDMLFQAYF